ncbi:MAG: hypothetical protein LIO67_08040 [Lachnospiraceae bacterium]|nr:hypothetical protein [Lachnospiraceae bacterium]
MHIENLTFEKEANLPAILLMSHGPICNAMLESAAMLSEDLEEIYALPFTDDMDLVEYTDKAEEIYNNAPKGSIVLFDLFGGTPCIQMTMRYGDIGLHGLSGLNLPMLLDAVSFRRMMRGKELIEALKESTRKSIVSADIL